jgi:hypothetical protein
VCDFDAQDETVVRVGQVATVGLAVQQDAFVLGYGQELFEVLRLPHQPVRVINDHMPDGALTHHFEHLVPAGTLAVALPG